MSFLNELQTWFIKCTLSKLHQEWSGYRTFYLVRMYNYDSSLGRMRIFYNILSIFQYAELCKTDNELKIKTVSSTFYKRLHKPVKSRSYNELFVWVLLGGRRADLGDLGLRFCSLVWEEDQKWEALGERTLTTSSQLYKTTLEFLWQK